MMAIVTALLMQFVPSESAKPLIVLTYKDPIKDEPDVRFALYDDGSVVFDSQGAGQAIDLKAKRLSPSEFANVRSALTPDPAFADLKSNYHVGNVPDAPVYRITAKMGDGYKSVAVGGLLEIGAAPPFTYEPGIARAGAPLPFIYLLDAILSLRFDNASPVRMRTFTVQLTDLSLLERDANKECRWPSRWPSLKDATNTCGPYAITDCYWLRFEGNLWSEAREVKRRCKRMVVDQRVFHMTVYSRLPGSALWLHQPPPPSSDLSFGPRCKSDSDCKAGQECARWGAFAGPNPRRTCEIPCNRGHPCAKGLSCNYFEDEGPSTALRGVCLRD